MSLYGHLQSPVCIGPQCSIDIYNPSNPEQHKIFEAIIDSGAAMTCIPESILTGIGELVRGKSVGMKSANGECIVRETFYVGIRLSNFQTDISKLWVICIPPKGYVILGRDIINEHKVALDARNRVWRLNCGETCN
ncbi:MAG: retropepsin-like domain-containing protein [Pseudanabaenales cyanobacterium]|nr:retropepsin-like domain-containing protein [Pseudanabaenales cyanobacterium]